MDDQDEQPTSRGSEEIVRLLSSAQAYIQTLPPVERRIATLAASGSPVWEIAQLTSESEGAVARTLDGIIAVVTGREIEPFETGGLGADTDPGVTGGYGDTGFGALDTEPIPDNTEPEE
ncbi:MAG TPA: hypothetical protein VH482_14815 [Thermomicrobiales bacterium]|jgi:hypothetical protein